MLQLSHRRERGLTLVELMIGLAIVGFTLSIGVPSMSQWMTANKARAAIEYYADGLATARRQALMHNSRSRIVLSQNAANGQYDWRVDICFPQPGTACTDTTGNWSSASAAAKDDPEGTKGYKSIARVAEALPASSVMAPALLPAGSSSLYFTEMGWVDTALDGCLASIRLTPNDSLKDDVPVVALAVSLSGMATKCEPGRSAGDSRACP